MAKTFKALSLLLSYPSEELQQAAGELREVIRSEALIDPERRAALDPFLDDLGHSDLFELQERYVELFDKTRRLSLHLFEHVHGESRDRGQAMVDLAALYEQNGLALAANELPDYLPLFLEFLSVLPFEEALSQLANAQPIIAAIEERLRNRNAAYAAVFAAIRSIGSGQPVASEPEAPAEDAVDDLAALDAEWEETAVVFGPGEAMDRCSVDRIRTQIRAGQRDVRRASA